MFRILTALALLATPAAAADLPFDQGWSVQRLSLFANNSWGMDRSGLSVVSDSSVSIVWTRLGPEHWDAREASWTWEVSESVRATDLQRKGGDDRNWSVYFFFLPEEEARSLGRAGIRDMQGNETARVLTYIWGGDYPRGAAIGSPWLGAQGEAVILRSAGVGAFSETVDLRSDFAAAFGAADMALVGVAVSADSDDTRGRVVGRMSGFMVR